MARKASHVLAHAGPQALALTVLTGHLHPDAGGAGLCLRRRDWAGRFGGVFFRGAGIGI